MTSRQVNFYVLPEEQSWLEGVIRSAGPFRIVARLDASGDPRLVLTTVVQRFGEEHLRVHLVREADVDKIRPVGAPNRTELFVDDLRSPVIEYWRCFSDGEVLRRGRLYLVESYYDEDGRLVRKDPSFVAWGRAVLATVRRSLKRRNDGDYGSILALQREREARLRLTAA